MCKVNDPEVMEEIKKKFGLTSKQIMKVVSRKGPQFLERMIDVRRGTFIPVSLEVPEESLRDYYLGWTYVDNIRYAFWIGVEAK